MDHFGIGAAIRGAALTYLHSARQTGRTTSLIESVKDGDRILFASAPEADRVRRLCKERDVEVECIVVSPEQWKQRFFGLGTSQGRTLFDHTLVEKIYMQAIEAAQHEIDFFERQLSGYGEAHRETRRRAEEIAKWAR